MSLPLPLSFSVSLCLFFSLFLHTAIPKVKFANPVVGKGDFLPLILKRNMSFFYLYSRDWEKTIFPQNYVFLFPQTRFLVVEIRAKKCESIKIDRKSEYLVAMKTRHPVLFYFETQVLTQKL